MRIVSTGFAALLLLAACASSTQDNGAPDVISDVRPGVAAPLVEVTQLSSSPPAAEHVSGGMPVRFQVRITNRAGAAITLQRVTLSSIGEGAYDLNQTAMPFNEKIEPGASAVEAFWVATNASNTILGNNGPVTVRAVTQFDCAAGKFQTNTTHQVSGGFGPP